MDSVTSTPFTFEQNMRLIDLAYDCVYINSSEKEASISLVEEKFKEGIIINVTDFFKQEKYVSDKRIQYLLDLDAHMTIRRRDFQFGRIATANGMTAEANIANALKYQETYFKNNRINMRIGDILVGNGSLSPADQISILLTQNRIKDENLADALSEMGKTRQEKDAINKRFGAIALKKEFVTIEQLKASLEIQKQEIDTKGKARFMGQILKESAGLSDKDLQQVLQAQKQFEKRRLDLEKALYNVKSEIKIAKKLNTFFEYSISNDGLEASAKKIREIEEEIPVYEFLIWLKRIGIKFGITDDDTLEQFIRKSELKSQITIAHGHPPEPCIDERVEIYFETGHAAADSEQDDENSENQDTDEKETREKDEKSVDESQDTEESGSSETEKPEEDEPEENKPDDNEKKPDAENTEDQEKNRSVDEEADSDESGDNSDENGAEEQSSYVKHGSLIAEIIPGREGKPGKNVLGYPITPPKPSICTINTGNGVEKRGSSYFAQIDGQPVLKGGTTLIVEPVSSGDTVKNVMGDISKDTETTYENSSVELYGNITGDGFLRCHSLIMNGNMEGSAICSGDMEIKGGVGTDKKTEEEKTSKASIICQGSFKVSKSIVNSTIHAAGEIVGFNSMVIGSELLAKEGINIKDAVNSENSPTTLQFGLTPGDKTLPLDQAIQAKKEQLSVLTKVEEIAELTEEYEKELEEAQTYEAEQLIYKNLIEIIGGPELFQHDALQDKINYLYSLPDYSSVRAYYLKLPETEIGKQVLDKILKSIENISIDDALEHFKNKIEREDEDRNKEEDKGEDSDDSEDRSEISKIENNYKARLTAVEKEIEAHSQEIEGLNVDIKGLKSLKEKMVAIHVKSLPRSSAYVVIKNKCEKGTIIKGKVSRLILDKTLYKIRFKEVLDSATGKASIVIEEY